MSVSSELSIVSAPADWLPLAIPGAEGVSVKIYKVNTVKPADAMQRLERLEPSMLYNDNNTRGARPENDLKERV